MRNNDQKRANGMRNRGGFSGKKPLLCFALSCALLSVIALTGCSPEGGQREARTARTETVFALDTVASITYYEGKDAEAVKEALALLGPFEKIFSATDPESELSRLNAAGGRETLVSQDLFSVLQTAIEVAEATGGAFDCTLGGVSELYGFGSDSPSVPDEETLQEALRHTGYEKVILNEEKRTVTVTDPELKIDLGGIAKGYIADELKAYLVKRGVKSAIINLGRNILLVGDKAGKTEPGDSDDAKLAREDLFAVGIYDPNSEDPFYVYRLADQSVVTSGNYERCFKVDGVLYHHILDPETGIPVRNGLLSVTIVSSSSILGDALSTAAFVLGEGGCSELKSAFPGITITYVDEFGDVWQGE